MKNTGMVRKFDELGRLTIPIELRRNLGVEVKSPMEIYTNSDEKGEFLVLRKYEAVRCSFCGSSENLSQFKGKNICQSCKDELKK